ncbi:MAG: hypothetical protein K6U74_00385 [Firmicutes bacterium]|nr:hypothetical protein [Bacillota bacterium]
MRYPSLTFKEWQTLVKRFAVEVRGLGSPVVVGINRHGKPFTVHFHPCRRLKPSQTARLVRRLGLAPEEFRRWREGR